MKNSFKVSSVAVFGFLSFISLTMLSACQKQAPSHLEVDHQNLVQAGNPQVHQVIGDESNQYVVLGQQNFAVQIRSGSILTATSAGGRQLLESVSEGAVEPLASPAPSVSPLPTPSASPSASPSPAGPFVELPTATDSLLLQIPVGLLGQENVFGAVITKVSEVENQDLGSLKLTDLSPVHVRTGIMGNAKDGFVLALKGCTDKCTETSEQEVVAKFPIIGIDSSKSNIIVDLAPIAAEFDLLKILDPDSTALQLKTKKAKTVTFDYSLSTLVFDIETHMVPLKEFDKPDAHESVFTSRWYLKLSSAFTPGFASRGKADGVGFFMTDRSADAKIERHSLTSFGGAPVKYFVKNVPAEYQAAFASAFDEWNEKLLPVLGRKFVDYEFLSSSDPRNALLVPGDVRHNVLEWDLMNKATYGGLGPSIANQFTGEILSSNVLIQGPTVIALYTKWFAASKKAESLRDHGQSQLADEVLIQAKRSIDRDLARLPQARFELSLGTGAKALQFRIPSQTPPLQDPLMDTANGSLEFEEIPAGYTFEKYMFGYFHDMVAHELGHNWGLRHNFRGNLGSDTSQQPGSVSRSIMEYLGRGFRHLDHIGAYDVMAIAYGYTGKLPQHSDWFCTDEDQPNPEHPTHSAECSSNDATPDPFSFFEARLTKSVNLLVARGKAEAPVWKLVDMKSQVGAALNGLAAYASSAEVAGAGWTNFFGKLDRPASPAGVKAYVLAKLKGQVCDPSLTVETTLKTTDASKAQVQQNLKDLRAEAVKAVTSFKIGTEEDLKCSVL